MHELLPMKYSFVYCFTKLIHDCRFYDSSTGSLQLDSTDLRDINIRWLRSQIGIVSQEPVLFDASIAHNIRYGITAAEISDEDVVNAAKMANIHHFVQSLPQVSVLRTHIGYAFIVHLIAKI